MHFIVDGDNFCFERVGEQPLANYRVQWDCAFLSGRWTLVKLFFLIGVFVANLCGLAGRIVFD